MADDEGLAGEGVGGEAGEVEDGGGDVIDGGEFAVDGFFEHDVTDDFGFGDAEFFGLFGDLFFDQGGADEAGADDVGAHTVFGAFFGEDFAEADEAVFGGDVGGFEFGGFFGVDGADIDDGAAFLGVHVFQAGAGGEECAVEMDGEEFFPIGEGEIDQGFDDLDAGVADQHVDPAEFFEGGIDAVLNLLLVGDVHGDGEGFGAGLADFGGGGLGGIEVEVGDDGVAAFAGELFGDGATDAAGGAGDDANFSVKTSHG